jgi:putative oxidoreductase
MDTGLLIARLVVGSLMAAHGAQKLFGWFGGYGVEGTGHFMEGLGFRPGRFFAAAAGFGELASGVLTALGLFGPVGPAWMLSVMIVAAVSVHWPHGLFAMSNGIELPLLYGTAATALALTGPGVYSVDALLGLTLAAPGLAWAALAIGVAGAFGTLATRRTPAVATA